jgi:hypothetical protein
MANNDGVRWGHLHQIDYRTKVGSEAWKARHSNNIQHLSAYRRLEEVAGHDIARQYVDSPVNEKLKAIEKHDKKK